MWKRTPTTNPQLRISKTLRSRNSNTRFLRGYARTGTREPKAVDSLSLSDNCIPENNNRDHQGAEYPHMSMHTNRTADQLPNRAIDSNMIEINELISPTSLATSQTGTYFLEREIKEHDAFLRRCIVRKMSLGVHWVARTWAIQ